MTYKYQQLANCQYPVFSPGTPTLEDDCGEPAVFLVWFIDENGNDFGEWKVCKEHLNTIVIEETNGG